MDTDGNPIVRDYPPCVVRDAQHGGQDARHAVDTPSCFTRDPSLHVGPTNRWHHIGGAPQKDDFAFFEA